MRRAGHIFLFGAIGAHLLVAASPLAMGEPKEGDGASAILTEITDLVNPITNGGVTRVVWQADGGVIHVQGRGQAVEDGWGFRLARGQKSHEDRIYMLGINSPLAKENGVWSAQPKLVDAVGSHEYILNIASGASFPTPYKEGADRGSTGNVVLFDARTESFRNLTNLGPDSGQSARALRWFPEDDILLLEVMKLDRVAMAPRPRRGGGRCEPVCLHLPTGAERPLDEFPHIEQWYRRHRSIEVSAVRRDSDQATAWKVSNKLSGEEVVVRGSRTAEPLWVVPLDESLICVAHSALGTYLVSFDGETRVRVSNHHAIDYHERSGRLVLRSAETNSEGYHRYWLMELDRYLENVMQKRER